MIAKYLSGQPAASASTAHHRGDIAYSASVVAALFAPPLRGWRSFSLAASKSGHAIMARISRVAYRWACSLYGGAA
jgi:hypothetical protein